jgi:hypothetical protein
MSVQRLTVFQAAAPERPLLAVQGRLAAELLVAAAASAVVLAMLAARSVGRLEPVPLAVAWSVVPVLLVLVPQAWRGAPVLEALAAQALPRAVPDVSEARLVVA